MGADDDAFQMRLLGVQERRDVRVSTGRPEDFYESCRHESLSRAVRTRGIDRGCECILKGG